MQRKTKGYIAAFVLLIIAISTLSGCGTGNGNDTSLQNELTTMQRELDRLQDELSSLQEANDTPAIGNSDYVGNSPAGGSGLFGNSPVRWEYTAIAANDAGNRANLIQEANRLGAEGWELVIEASAWGHAWIFKRPLP